MKMHFCTARVNLSGQGFHIFEFLATDPISWPEAQVLMALHGEENVMDIKPCAIADVNPAEEKRRLLGKYATYAKVVEQCFPGRTFRMELLMPGEDDHQRPVDGEGTAYAQMPDDDDDDDELREPPSAVPVFKPGRVAPPKPAEKPLEA